MPYYFTNVEQWVTHWNTFHVAVAAGYTCTAGECGAKVPPGPDALDVFMQHVVRNHDELSQNTTWPTLPMMVHRGTFMGPNPHYWQPRQPHEKPYRPCRVLPYPNEEEAGPVIQARLAARRTFQDLVQNERRVKKQELKKGKKTQLKEWLTTEGEAGEKRKRTESQSPNCWTATST